MIIYMLGQLSTNTVPKTGDSLKAVPVRNRDSERKFHPIENWQPLGALLVAVYSLVVAKRSLRLNRRTFEENRRRAAYNLLMTQPALREIPSVSMELERLLRERHASMTAAADTTTTTDFRKACRDATEAAKALLAPLERRLIIAANAWGDEIHANHVRNALEDWIDGVSAQIGEWTKPDHDIEESISVHDRGQAKLLRCIVEKDCSDQTPPDAFLKWECLRRKS